MTWTPASSPAPQGTGQGVLAFAELGSRHHGQSESGFVTPRGASLPRASLGRGLLCFAAANPPTAPVTLPGLHVSYEWNPHPVAWGGRPLPCRVVVSGSATCGSCPLLCTHSGFLARVSAGCRDRPHAAWRGGCAAGGAGGPVSGPTGVFSWPRAHTGRGPAGPHCASVSPPPRGTDHTPWFQPPWRNREAGREAAPPFQGCAGWGGSRVLGRPAGALVLVPRAGPASRSRGSTERLLFPDCGPCLSAGPCLSFPNCNTDASEGCSLRLGDPKSIF